MLKNSKTSLIPGVFRELCLLFLAVLFGSLPFVAAAQAQENPHGRAVFQHDAAQSAIREFCFQKA
jgi:hypothetical protein